MELFKGIFKKREDGKESVGALGQEKKEVKDGEMSETEVFSEAVKAVEREWSGNPQQKFNRDALLKQGSSNEDYGEAVIKEAKRRLEEIPGFREKIIQDNEILKGEHFGAPSLEHTNPEEYKRQKEEAAKEEERINNLKGDIENTLSK